MIWKKILIISISFFCFNIYEGPNQETTINSINLYLLFNLFFIDVVGFASFFRSFIIFLFLFFLSCFFFFHVCVFFFSKFRNSKSRSLERNQRFHCRFVDSCKLKFFLSFSILKKQRINCWSCTSDNSISIWHCQNKVTNTIWTIQRSFRLFSSNH